MRLKTKLVLSTMGVTFAMVVALSALFLGQLLRQRIAQTASDSEVLAREVWLMTKQAIETGVRAHPPAMRTDVAFHTAVADALRGHDPLADTMNAIVKYSPTVQDVSVTDAHGLTLVSTDPDALNQQEITRTSLASVRDGDVGYQIREMFGSPRVLDIAMPLDRNGKPFVIVHVGVRSTFLRATYAPWLQAALWSTLAAALLSMLAAAVLANAALQPIKRISEQLEILTTPGQQEVVESLLGAPRVNSDAEVEVARTIDRLGRQMRTTEAGYTALQSNLNQILDTLRDGVLLFTADRRAVMVSDAVAHFIPQLDKVLVGKALEEIFKSETPLGAAVLAAFAAPPAAGAETVVLEDGRRVQFSLDRIDDGEGGSGKMGTLLTLRDTESAMKLEQELEVSRRLVAIGRLTAGVGHEVKNPINAMVVHLELLRSKLTGIGGNSVPGAKRHVDILAGEMQRLDRVVQTLADFTRPMELHLGDYDLRQVITSVVELTGAEMLEAGVHVEFMTPTQSVMVRVDADLIRQALLNLLLNGMQAMPRGGVIQVRLHRHKQNAVVEVIDEGEGIRPELLPRIFDLYFTTKPTGSGIGLAMTYRILQMHGGILEVRSDVNPHSVDHGTTITLQLPVALSTPQMEAQETGRSESLRMEMERHV